MLVGYEIVICILKSVFIYEGKKINIYRVVYIRIFFLVKDN